MVTCDSLDYAPQNNISYIVASPDILLNVLLSLVIRLNPYLIRTHADRNKSMIFPQGVTKYPQQPMSWAGLPLLRPGHLLLHHRRQQQRRAPGAARLPTAEQETSRRVERGRGEGLLQQEGHDARRAVEVAGRRRRRRRW